MISAALETILLHLQGCSQCWHVQKNIFRQDRPRFAVLLIYNIARKVLVHLTKASLRSLLPLTTQCSDSHLRSWDFLCWLSLYIALALVVKSRTRMKWPLLKIQTERRHTSMHFYQKGSFLSSLNNCIKPKRKTEGLMVRLEWCTACATFRGYRCSATSQSERKIHLFPIILAATLAQA